MADNPLAKQPVVLELPGMDAVSIERNVALRRRAAPALLVRAGRDEAPGLNAALDRFVPRTLEANVPLTLVNYPEGAHAFDIVDASSESRAVIRQILAFLRAQLLEATDRG